MAAHRIRGKSPHGRHAERRLLPGWLRPRRRRRGQLPRQLALGLLEDAMGQVQQADEDSGGQAQAG